MGNKWKSFVICRKHRLTIGTAIGVSLYLGFYLGTTVVRSKGSGGLTGPLKVRVFKNENHLIAFYPLYLVERWGRNGSLTDASYYFNVDFKDGHYDRTWLYGDGKYSKIWYAF